MWSTLLLYPLFPFQELSHILAHHYGIRVLFMLSFSDGDLNRLNWLSLTQCSYSRALVYKSKTLFFWSGEGLFDRNLSCTFQDSFILLSSLSFAWTYLVIMLFDLTLGGIFEKRNSPRMKTITKSWFLLYNTKWDILHNVHVALFHTIKWWPWAVKVQKKKKNSHHIIT